MPDPTPFLDRAALDELERLVRASDEPRPKEMFRLMGEMLIAAPALIALAREALDARGPVARLRAERDDLARLLAAADAHEAREATRA